MKKIGSFFIASIKKTIVGAFCLYGANVLLEYSDVHISMNLFTSFIAGSLGLPGILALAAIHFFIFGGG